MKIKCQALDSDGNRCKNIARYKEHYHGDGEIYGYDYEHPDKDITWCEIFVCKKHLKTHPESENFAGKIDIDKDVFITSQTQGGSK